MTGVPEILSSASGVANTAFDSGVIPVNKTRGNFLVLVTASAAAIGQVTVSDDLGNALLVVALNGDVGLAAIFGNADGAPAALTLSLPALPVLVASQALPGGEGAVRPRGLRVQIAALGVGIVGRYVILGERE